MNLFKVLFISLVFGCTPVCAMQIIAPDKAENGAVIPVEVKFDKPLISGQRLELWVNDKLATHVGIVEGEISNFKIRVKSSSIKTTIKARILGGGNDGSIVSKNVIVTVVSSIGGSPSSVTALKEKKINGEIKLLMDSMNGFAGMLVLKDNGFNAEITGSAGVSKNPFVSVKGKFTDKITAKMKQGDGQATELARAPGNSPSRLVVSQEVPKQTSVNGKSVAASNGGKWPVGVVPGNLYIVTYGQKDNTYDKTLLVAAKSKEQAVAMVKNGIIEHNLIYNSANSIYKLSIKDKVVECIGSNWGATIMREMDRNLVSVSSCGANSPREAIQYASQLCSRKLGQPCNVAAGEDVRLIVSIGHSGAMPWRGTKPGPVDSAFPHTGMIYSSLGASTGQSTNFFIRSPEEAISQFGKTCGSSMFGRDAYSCWITSKNLDCIMSVEGNPRDKLPNQQKCVDSKLTAEGYLP